MLFLFLFLSLLNMHLNAAMHAKQSPKNLANDRKKPSLHEEQKKEDTSSPIPAQQKSKLDTMSTNPTNLTLFGAIKELLDRGLTPEEIAAKIISRNINITALRCTHALNPIACANKDCQTPTQWAVNKKLPLIVKVLLAAGLPQRQINEALMDAIVVVDPSVELVEVLVSWAEMGKLICNHTTYVHAALDSGNKKIMEMVIAAHEAQGKKKNLNMRNGEKKTVRERIKEEYMTEEFRFVAGSQVRRFVYLPSHQDVIKVFNKACPKPSKRFYY